MLYFRSASFTRWFKALWTISSSCSLVSAVFVSFQSSINFPWVLTLRYFSALIKIGTSGINWVSEDCGGNIKALNSGKSIQEFIFHPTQRSWALAASWTTCAEFIDEPCRIYKELYYTKDMGENWSYVTNYVFDFEWGQSKIARDGGVGIPDDRVWVTRDATNTKH